EAARPIKAPSQDAAARTADRHRWAGRAYRGGRATLRQGTRQLGPVTSGEGAPRQGEAPRARSQRGREGDGPGACLLKTPVPANARSCGRIGAESCAVPEG